jgi:hypothetical protein
MTLQAPCLVNHEGVVCCGDRRGFSGASQFTVIAPVHCTGYQIIRPHFQTCGPNIEKLVEENFVQRLKVRSSVQVCAASADSAVSVALQDMCAAVTKAIEWRRFKNSLMKQYQLKGAPAAVKQRKA